MSGYHAVAVQGQVKLEDLVGIVYQAEAVNPVAVDGEDGFPWGMDGDRAAAAHVGGWTVLAGSLPAELFSDEEAEHLAGLSRGRTLVRWFTEDTVGGIGLDVYENGARVRSFYRAEGEVLRAEGSPLEGEPEGGLEAADPFEVGEWEMVAVVERHALSWERMGEAEYQMYTLAGGGELS